MRIAICDDDEKCIARIEGYVHDLNGQCICDKYLTGKELLEKYSNNDRPYDAVFLDIEMKDLSGIETATMIREFDEYVVIIFISSHTEYVYESFRCEPFRFLVKPVTKNDFGEAFSAMSKKLSRHHRILTFMQDDELISLRCEEILYCESSDHWTLIYTKKKVYRICKSLSALHSQLDKNLIHRIHRSFIVNFHYVKRIEGYCIYLSNCSKPIPIGRTYKKNVIIEYTNFIERDFYI